MAASKTSSNKSNTQSSDSTKDMLEEIAANYIQIRSRLLVLVILMSLSLVIGILAVVFLKEEYQANLNTGWISSNGELLVVGGMLKIDSTGILKIRQANTLNWNVLIDKALPPVRSMSVDNQGKRAMILCDNGILLSTGDLGSFKFKIDSLPLNLQPSHQFHDIDVDWENGRGIITSDSMMLYCQSILSDTAKWGYVNLVTSRFDRPNQENLSPEAASEILDYIPISLPGFYNKSRPKKTFGLSSLFPPATAQDIKRPVNKNIDIREDTSKQVEAKQAKPEEVPAPTINNLPLQTDYSQQGRPHSSDTDNIGSEPISIINERNNNDTSDITFRSLIPPITMGFSYVEINWSKGLGIALDFRNILWVSNNFGTQWTPARFSSGDPDNFRFSTADLIDTKILLVNKQDSMWLAEFIDYPKVDLFPSPFNIRGIIKTDILTINEGIIANENNIYSIKSNNLEAVTQFNNSPNYLYANSSNALASGANDMLYVSTNGLDNWQVISPPTTGNLSMMGYILFTPGMLFTIMFFIGGILSLRKLNILRQDFNEKLAEQKSVNPLVMVSGSPTDKDTLGFDSVVDSIIYLINSPEVAPPVHIAVSGEWGSGKSSIMLQVKRKLEEENENGQGKNVTVWFNIWHLESQRDVLISFLRSIYEAFDKQGILFRIKTFLNRTEKFSFFENILFWFGILLILPLVWFTIGQILFVFIGERWSWTIFNPFSIEEFLTKVFINGMENGVLPGLITPGIFAALSLVIAINKLFGSGIASLKSLLPIDRLKLRFLKEDVGFKETYKHDFTEIIKAGISKDLKLIIFIDDLDRVSGEKVKDLLTAINFISDTASNFQHYSDTLHHKQSIGLPVYFVSGMASSIVVKSLNTILEKEGKGNGILFLEKMYDLVVPVPEVESDKFSNLTER